MGNWGRKCLVDFNAWKTQLVSFDQPNNSKPIYVKMNGFVLEQKQSFKMLRFYFSSKLDLGSYIVSIAKTASKEIGALFLCMKCVFPEVALYLFKSTMRPCSFYLDILDKVQKQVCRTVCPSLTASLEPTSHHRNVANLSLSYRYYFSTCSSELAELVPFPHS